MRSEGGAVHGSEELEAHAGEQQLTGAEAFLRLLPKLFSSSTAKDWADRRKDLRFDLFFTPHKAPLCEVKN